MNSMLIIAVAFGLGVVIGAFLPLARKAPRLKAVVNWVDTKTYSATDTPVGNFRVVEDRGDWQIWCRPAPVPPRERSERERDTAKATVEAIVNSKFHALAGR